MATKYSLPEMQLLADLVLEEAQLPGKAFGEIPNFADVVKGTGWTEQQFVVVCHDKWKRQLKAP